MFNPSYKCAGTIIVFKREFNSCLTKEMLDIIKNYSELILSDNFNCFIKIIPSQ